MRADIPHAAVSVSRATVVSTCALGRTLDGTSRSSDAETKAVVRIPTPDCIVTCGEASARRTGARVGARCSADAVLASKSMGRTVSVCLERLLHGNAPQV